VRAPAVTRVTIGWRSRRWAAALGQSALGLGPLVFDPVEVLGRLAVLVPRPRINLVLDHGVLGPRVAAAGWLPHYLGLRHGARPAGGAARPDRRGFSTKPQGSGMGLPISLLNRRGARWAAANAGRGATFHFTLPRDTTNQPLAEPGRSS
jgi:hypothetical protein